jgi:hypothetical protein
MKNGSLFLIEVSAQRSEGEMDVSKGINPHECAETPAALFSASSSGKGAAASRSHGESQRMQTMIARRVTMSPNT